MTQGDLFADAIEEARPDVVHYPRQFRDRWTLEQIAAVLPLHRNVVNGTKVPRLECWFGDRHYAFGGRVEEPKPWPELIVAVRDAVEAATSAKFDSCFANMYMNENDSIAWHADDAPWIGEPIASVSFGATRRFVMRDKATRAVKRSYMLGDGDLFIMAEGTQARWEHSIPRTSDVVGPRLNLTFRSTLDI